MENKGENVNENELLCLCTLRVKGFLFHKVLMVILLLLGFSLNAENPAIIAEPQTAKWAQKWWMPRHESRLLEIKESKGRFDYVFIGDSITQGWQGKAARNALAKDFRGKKILNLGFKGDYTGHVLWRLKNGELDGVKAKVAVVMIGTNNTTRGDSSAQTAEGVKAIIKQVREGLPSTKILLLSVFPRAKLDHKFRKTNEGINAIIKEFADQRNIFWFDMGPILMDKKGLLYQDLFARDQLHLKDKGYEVWSKALANELDALDLK